MIHLITRNIILKSLVTLHYRLKVWGQINLFFLWKKLKLLFSKDALIKSAQ